MRVNIYAEEMTERVEITSKRIDEIDFTGLRLYLYLPVTHNGEQVQGPFLHREDDDDSSAITFWGKRDLRKVLMIMMEKLDEHYKDLNKLKPMDLPIDKLLVASKLHRAELASYCDKQGVTGDYYVAFLAQQELILGLEKRLEEFMGDSYETDPVNQPENIR